MAFARSGLRACPPLRPYERARRLANIVVWTAQFQRQRLSTNEPEDGLIDPHPLGEGTFLGADHIGINPSCP